MTVIFFWRCLKFYLHFKNAEKNCEKAFYFLHNCIWILCVNLVLLRRENLWPAVNVFTNSPKIFQITEKDFFQLKYPHGDQYICWTFFGLDFNSVWTHVPCCISKGLQKHDFLDIYLTTFFRVRNFQNTSAMRVIFLSKCSYFYQPFKNREQNSEKNFLLEMIASKFAVLNCLYLEENTCDRQSMC